MPCPAHRRKKTRHESSPMKTYFIRHDRMAVTTSVLDRLRHDHLVAIHFPWRHGSSRLPASDNTSLNSEDYSGGAVRAINTLNRLSKQGGYIFAQYRGSPQVLVGVVRPQKPKIFRTWWSDRNREAKLKTLKVGRVKLLNAPQLLNMPAKPARGTIAEWHKAKTFVSRLVDAPKSGHKPDSSRSVPLAKNLKQTAEYLDEGGAFDPRSVNDARQFVLASIVQRRGQPQFREKLLRVYGKKCAISGCAIEAVLEAAHIIKYRGQKTNHVQNGILLRTDLHTLFDLGLLTISASAMTVRLHHSLRTSYCAQFEGKPLRLPKRKNCWPNKASLVAHRKHC